MKRLIDIDELADYLKLQKQTIYNWLHQGKISGIMIEKFESQNALSAHLHLSELQFLTGKTKDDNINRIYVSLHRESDTEDVKKWINTEFAHKDKVSAHTPKDLISDITDLTKMLDGFSRMVVIITILVATLFITTVLMISIP